MSNIKWRNDGSGLGDADYLPDGVVMHDMVYRLPVKGAKKKPKQPRKPVITKDSAASISFFKGLYGTSEGEIYGLVDGGKSIFLEGTPLLDDDGNPNFENVTWEERKGTLNQEYMKGFPDVSNEVGIGVELKGGTPWVRSITNTQLSAIRLRFKWDRLAKTNPDNGDVTGYRIDYAIDLRTDGGAYQEVLSTKIEDKTSAGYERTHRIDLPKSKTGWSVRVRRITPNANSEYIADRMYVDALAEVIDVKLAYPYTAGIGLQYNAETFNGVAKVEFLKRGRIIKVPTNYNAETRTYTGIWDGTFKEAYSNNPAWVLYDLLTNKRYGLGNRLDASMIDKWSIYNHGRHCDQMVSDGQGGLEPRFTCNVYLQKQATAYEVLQHIAGIFSALSYWNGEKIFLDADIPRDPVFTFTNANVVGGGFNYSGTRDRDRHNIIKVAWDNPANGFKTEYEYVRDERSIALNGIKPLDLAAFGCTSQSQAQRLGLRALKTEQLETQQVTFATGLAAINCKVGDVIAISDASLAGKSNGGLISNVAGNVITIDRDAVINVGDTLTVNTAKGLSERRNVTAVSGRNITVAAAFDGAEREHVWSVESSDLKMQLFRVMSVTENDDATYSVLGIQHEPQKFNAIDFGTDVKPTSISIVDDIAITPPESVVIKSRHRVEQGQTVATLIIEWSQVKEAVAYEVEWRKDDGSWVRVPRTGTNSVEIDGVYAGQYLARVRSVGAFDSVSNATTSMLTEVKGKVGKPPALANLKAVGKLFSMELSWSFAQGSKDADYVEIEQGSAPDTNVSLLGQFSYPTDRHEITGLQGGLTRSYRARLVDKLGFKSDWTAWATATVDDSADKVLDLIEGQIKESHLYEALSQKIDKIEPIGQKIDQEVRDRIGAISDIAQQMALVSSGIGEQFDSLKIWHFDSNDEGWTGGTYNNGYLNARTTNLVSPTVEIDGKKYKHVKLRIEKVGNPTWSGLVTWSGGSATIPAPEFKDNVATVGVPVTWGDTLNSFSIKLAQTADNLNYYKVDWIAVGRPSPGASFAALLDEKSERQLGDKANATKIEGVIAFTGADSDMAGSTQDLAGADSRLAGSWSVYDAIIDGDNYTGQRLDTTIAKVEENKAAVLQEQLARVDGDNAIAADVTLLKIDYGTTKAAVERLELAYSTPESGVAASITRLEASAKEAARLLTEKGEIIFSYGEPPADKRGAANLWFKLKDEADKSISQTPHSWDGSKWVELKAADALDAKRAAEAAQETASNKGEVIYSSTTPSADKRLTQNIWIDTAAGKNTPKRWDGSAWVIVSDKSVLEQIGKENVASFVRTSGSFVTEFDGISGEIATNQAVINGVRQSIEVVNSIGDADKLKTEITKAEIAKNVAGVEAQRDKLNVLIADYTKKRTEATSSRDKATDASVKAVYQTQIDVLTKSITETTAERNSLNARITELNKNISELNSLKLTESNIKKQYFVKFDSGNRAAGFGIMENANATIDFAILADKFYIASPSGTGKGIRPFAVYTSPTTINGVTVPAGTYLDGNLLATGTITGDKIAAKTEINAPIIKGGQININDKFIVDAQGNMRAIGGYFEGDIAANSIDVGTLKRSAWMGGWKRYYEKTYAYRYPRSFTKTHSAMQPSLGSLEHYSGQRSRTVGSVLFEMDVFTATETTVSYQLLSVDDRIYVYVNGKWVGYANSGRWATFKTPYPEGSEPTYDVWDNSNDTAEKGQNYVDPMRLNLPKGAVKIQFVLQNDDGGEAQLIAIGDFVDNVNVKFA